MKRIISLVTAFCILLGSVLSMSGCSEKELQTWSRAEYISALGETFGLDTYLSEEAYFKDVTPDMECFKYVQSCYEWGILSNEKNKFKPASDASMEFALETAFAAAEIDLGEQTVIEYAISQNIIANDDYMSVKEKINVASAATVLNWAKEKYINKPIEPIEYVDLVDSVKDYTQEKETVVALSEDEYRLSAEIAAEMNVGDVFLAPGNEENPGGIARKVEAVQQNSDGTFSVITTEPELAEVCEELEVATVIVPTVENLILPEGVELIDNTDIRFFQDDFEVENLVSKKSVGNYSPINTATPKRSFTFAVNFTKGTVNLSPEVENLFGLGENIEVEGEYPYSAHSHMPKDKISTIPDRNLFGKDPYDNTEAIEAYKNGKMSLDDLKKALDLDKDQIEKNPGVMTNKFSRGFELIGTVKVEELYVAPEIKLKKNWFGFPVGIETLSTTINYEIESSLQLKGKLEDELTIAKFPVPVGGTGVTVDVEIKVFAKLNGELSVKAEIANNIKTEYSNGKVKKTATESSNLTAEVSATLDIGPEVSGTLKILGIDIVDVGVNAAVRFKAEHSAKFSTSYEVSDTNITIKRQTSYTLGVDAYIPIVTLEIGMEDDSLANKLNIKFKFPIVDEEKAYQFADIGKEDFVIWEEVQVLPLIEEIEDTSETVEMENTEENKIVSQDYLGISTYYVALENGETHEIDITSMPQGYAESELQWSVADSSIVTVSGGVITAVGSGVTEITVTTSDGIYLAKCTVSVAEKATEFVPLEVESAYGFGGGGGGFRY